jgi:membrane protein
MNNRASDRWKRLIRVYQKEIWLTANIRDNSPKGWLYAVLRVLSISATVFIETKALSRAAALSFSSMLGLGPLVAITVLVAGFALDNKDPDLPAKTLSRLIVLVAPQVGQMGKIPANDDGTPEAPNRREGRRRQTDSSGKAATPTPAPDLNSSTSAEPAAVPVPELSATQPDVQINPRLVKMMNNFIVKGRSGSAGVVGFLSFITIVLVLFKSIEDVFNEIWGVRSGRSLIMRVVYYWTILTLGSVLFFASITLLGASAFLSVFHQTVATLPFSDQVAAMLQWSVPLFTFALLVLLLTAFYRVIPNTRVFWRAALCGGLVVATLLMLNNYLTFLYVRRVIMTESLYGSLGLPLIVMFGLYIFWLYLLVGGQISYAVQNVHFRNSQAAWSSLTENMRERLTLIVLLTICRRFQACLPPVSSSHLSTMIKVPAQILNECLNRLVDMKLITPLPPDLNSHNSSDLQYQPARPLNRISLLEFKRLDDNLGIDPAGASLERLDPVLEHYDRALNVINEQDFFRKNLEELLVDFPFDESRPPFSTLTPRA